MHPTPGIQVETLKGHSWPCPYCTSALTVWFVSYPPADLHVRITDDKFAFTAEYPDLVAHHKLFSELAGVKEYLASSARLDRINAVPLG